MGEINAARTPWSRTLEKSKAFWLQNGLWDWQSHEVIKFIFSTWLWGLVTWQLDKAEGGYVIDKAV